MYGEGMTYDELEQFDTAVLSLENPQLQMYLMNQQELLPQHDKEAFRRVVQYV